MKNFRKMGKVDTEKKKVLAQSRVKCPFLGNTSCSKISTFLTLL